MTNVQINLADYGIEESKAKQIQAQFQPMLDKMVELEKEANEVFKMPIEEAAKRAKEVRLKYVKVRTGTAKIHREQKDFYLQAGRFVDGWKNAQLLASQGIEKRLIAIEKHEEIQRQKKIAELQEERAAALREYEVIVIPENLGTMSEDVWNNFLLGTRTNYEAQKEAERKAEEERIKKERNDKLHNERRRILIPVWNFLPKGIEQEYLADLTEGEFKLLLDNGEKDKVKHEAEQERIRKENIRLQEEKKAAEKKAESERKARDAQLKKEREQHEAKLREQQEEANRLKAELEAKKEAEAKAKAEEEERKEAEAKKGDGAKLDDLEQDIIRIGTSYVFLSSENKETYENVKGHLRLALGELKKQTA